MKICVNASLHTFIQFALRKHNTDTIAKNRNCQQSKKKEA